MDTYEIYNIIPKIGTVKNVHNTILGRRCQILSLEVGQRCLLLVDVGDKKIGPHRIVLSYALNIECCSGDSEIHIETENSHYYLRKITMGGILQ